MPVTAALVSAGVGAAVQLGDAAYKNYKAKKIAKSNIRPTYVPSPQIQQNADIAASRAGQGLSDASKALYGQENERNVSQSLDAILRGGGGTNQISDLYANNQDAMLKLASLDNQLQNQNITQFLNENSALGQENQTAWMVNKFDPYANKAQLAALLKEQSVEQLNKAGQTAEQGVSNYLTANLYNNKATPLTQAQKDAKYKYGNVYMPQNQQAEGSPLGDYQDSPSKRYIDMILNSDPINSNWDNTDNIG